MAIPRVVILLGLSLRLSIGQAYAQSGTYAGMNIGPGVNLNGYIPFPSDNALRHWASSVTDPNAPPMGMRLRLKASFDLSTFPADDQVILTALKKYGLIVADNGSAMFMSGTPDDSWNNSDLDRLKTLTASNFEVVLMGPRREVCRPVPPPRSPAWRPILRRSWRVSLPHSPGIPPMRSTPLSRRKSDRCGAPRHRCTRTCPGPTMSMRQYGRVTRSVTVTVH